MSDPFDLGPGSPGADPFRDAPLFRELQRVIASSSGPVNWELARQVGVATAVEAGTDPDPTAADRHSFEEAVRVAELQVARLTGLDSPGELAPVAAVRRAEWVNANAESLKALLEPAARRLTEAMDQATQEQMPPEMRSAAGFMGQLSPLLMGAQVGQVLGSLSHRVLGQYDVAVPRTGPNTMMFVLANIVAFEKDWSLDAMDFRTYVALHEVTHRFEFARPWVTDRFHQILKDFLSTLHVDIEGIQSKLSTLDAAGPEALQSLMESDEGLFGAELDDEQRIKLGRIQAFMAATEGHADHVMHVLGRQLLPSHQRIEEAVARIERPEHDPVFRQLLGVDVGRQHFDLGRAFCDIVVDLTDETTLSRMWESAEAMPSMPEIQEPRLWLARTV